MRTNPTSGKHSCLRPYAVAHHGQGERGWEIYDVGSRSRICADMNEGTAKSLCALINAASPLAVEYSIPAVQIAAIWRMIKDNGGLDVDELF